MRARRSALAVVAAMVVATTLGVSGAVAAPARLGDAGSGSGAPAAAVPAAGTFYPVPTHRLLGADTGYAMAPGTPVTVTPLGRSGMPSSGVSAVMVEVTASALATDTAVSVGPSGTAPSAPLLGTPSGTTRSALLTVPLGPAGGVDVAVSGGPASVTADLVGFYAADDTVTGSMGQSGGYQPVDETRLFDTDSRGPLAPGARQQVSVDLGPAVTPHTTALLVRATAVGPVAAGALLVSGAAGPATTAVSFGSTTSATNLVLVPTAGNKEPVGLTVANASAGVTGVALDLVGFYDDGTLGPNLRYRPLPQTTLVDTSTGLGTTALQPGRPALVRAADPVATDSTFGLVGVVSSRATAAADLSVDAGDAAAPGVVAVPTGPSTVAVQPEVAADRTVGLQVRGPGAIDLRFDVTGTFEAYPPVTNPAARGWVPALPGWQISATAP